jgi:DNA-binding Lrp family transcriptional regulator
MGFYGDFRRNYHYRWRNPLTFKTPRNLIMALDKIDHALLLALQKTGAPVSQTLAEAVSLTETPCARRLKRLEAEGYIDGYRTILSRSALKLGVLAFACVRFGVHTRELSDRFEREIRRFLASCHATTYR